MRSSQWTRLSPRERGLAVVTAVAAALFLGYLLVYAPARAHLAALDEEVDRIEQQVLNSAYMAARAYDINERYRRIASQHSTALTKAEIHDSLQRELDTLSLQNPEDAQDLARLSKAPRLLRIAQQQEGQLITPEEGGYREYQISLQIQNSGIEALAEFLHRLQESPQGLRVDRLDLSRRDPRRRTVDASLTVTRTVIDRAPEEAAPEPPPPPPPPQEGNLARNAGFEAYDAKARAFPEWEGSGVDWSAATDRATEGERALRAEAREDGATVGQVQSLVGGRMYQLSLDLAATGPAHLRILDADAGEALAGGQDAKADGNTYRYQARFQAPGPVNRAVSVTVPHIVLDEAGTVIHVDNVVLEEVQP